jgi:hypothetical protein
MNARNITIREGNPLRLGAVADNRGTNFAIFSSTATKVEVCLFDESRLSVDVYHSFAKIANVACISAQDAAKLTALLGIRGADRNGRGGAPDAAEPEFIAQVVRKALTVGIFETAMEIHLIAFEDEARTRAEVHYSCVDNIRRVGGGGSIVFEKRQGKWVKVEGGRSWNT